jgi:hypothetical protein
VPLQARLLIPATVAVLFSYTAAGQTLEVTTNDVVGFIGGAEVATAQHSGHLESLLAVEFAGKSVRFRNFGWEGDTVFEQPRDVGFPTLLSNLRKAGVTVVVVQFGRAEALSGKRSMAEFRQACNKRLDEFLENFGKVILVTPVPFEKGGGLLPDVSKRNALVAAHADVIRELARERGIELIDLFEELTKNPRPRLTADGVQLTDKGHAVIANAFLRATGRGGRDYPADQQGQWTDPRLEKVRQAVIAKNRLWFDYSRPQNWAFLGGDRTTQPSSRDHRDPKVRWFPAEMEKFVPLIAEAEKRIDSAAREALKP